MTFRTFKNKFTWEDNKSDNTETSLEESETSILRTSKSQNLLEINFKPKLLKLTSKKPLAKINQNTSQHDFRPLRKMIVKTDYEPMSSPVIAKREIFHSASTINLKEVSIN